eukprot:TRINITY_DN6919_c0_g1_i2.p1 TRINITY_DN6919_c0_g1~~TRINITY_DN6919_c0_g1_i2.p1  ORF type:complete len:249 (+),score=64.97 TRINITY_DN6919_c0_g1_i2:710-1456(+)
MLAVILPLLLTSLPLSQATDACVWQFHWSTVLTNNVNVTNPPRDFSCILYFNDNMLFYNGDTMDHFIYRVSNSLASMECDNSSLYTDDNGDTLPPVLVPAGAFIMFNVNRDKLDLTTLSQPYLISEKFGEDGDCLRSEFVVGGDQHRNCSNTELCLSEPPTTPNVTTTPTTTTIPATQTESSTSLNDVQIGLLAACCCLCFVDLSACVVLVVVFVYLMCRANCDSEEFSFKKGKAKRNRTDAEKHPKQ